VKGEKMISVASAQIRRAFHSSTPDYFSPFTFHFSPLASPTTRAMMIGGRLRHLK
jgi:hypothetical protein